MLAALSGCGLLPAAWGCGAMPRPVRLSGQRLRRRPDKCDAGPSSERTTNPSSRRKRQDSLTPLHRLLPAETQRSGFGGSPVGCGDKNSHFTFFRHFHVWGWDHYPRCAFHAVETLDARGSRRRIYRFYAAPEFALCGLNIPSAGTHANPAPNRAHSGSQGQTRAFSLPETSTGSIGSTA